MATREGVRFEVVVLALAAAFGASVVLDAFLGGVPLLRAVVGIAFLCFGPGALVLQLIGIDPELRADWLVYALGASLMFVMAVAFVLNFGLPQVGVSKPLTTGPLTVAVLLGTAGLAAAATLSGQTAWIGRGRDRRLVPDGAFDRSPWPTLGWPTSDAYASAWQPLLAVSLPLSMALAMTYLNSTYDPRPLQFLLLVIALLPAVAVLGLLEERYLAVAIWGMGLAILLHKSLFAGFAYGGHASVAAVWKSGVWPMDFETLAPNGLLMPAFARLTGVFVLTQVKVIMPLFVSAIPVALFVTFRRYAEPPTAFLGASLFVFAHPWFYQYPSTPRASIPVLFLVLLGVTISDRHHDLVRRRLLALLFGVGVAVSHYGTAYYVMFALLGTVAVYPLFALVEELARRAFRQRLSGRGPHTLRERVRASVLGRHQDVVRWDFVGFYVGAVVGWYFFVAGGAKFRALVNRIYEAYVSMFLESGGQGATATRLATDYGGLSIQYAKFVYLLVSALAGIGLVLVTVRRIVPRWETAVDDEYIVVSGMLFALFSATLLISGQWGGGRPTMIVLSFNALFAAVAATTLGRGVHRTLGHLAERRSRSLADAISDAPEAFGGRAAFAAILAAFFLLNSGFMAAVAYGGAAPSEVPTTDEPGADFETDMRVHLWLADNRDTGHQIYGDRLARAQTTDWMNGEIAARSERPPYRFKKQNFFSALNDTELKKGYLLMLRHNIEEGKVEVDYVTTRRIEDYRLDLDRRHTIYTNGQGRVHFTDNASVALYDPESAG